MLLLYLNNIQTNNRRHSVTNSVSRLYITESITSVSSWQDGLGKDCRVQFQKECGTCGSVYCNTSDSDTSLILSQSYDTVLTFPLQLTCEEKLGPFQSILGMGESIPARGIIVGGWDGCSLASIRY